MQDEESGDVGYWGIEEGSGVAVEEAWEARVEAFEAGAGVRWWGVGGLGPGEAEDMAVGLATRKV